MKPRFSDDTVTLYAGDCREALAELAPSSVDTICTDPPYELNFMGRAWDSSGIAYDVDMWRQCWRALKPGGHLLAFGGTRTYHRLVCAIEDANFEIRDSMHWITGSGFPKSLDVSKAIDKAAGAEREVLGPRMRLGDKKPYAHNREDYDGSIFGERGGARIVTAPTTDDARRWQGWGTALKPAHEPIVLARKPLAGTVAANVLRHGTGALNIDACRVDWDAASLAKDTARRQEPRHDMTGGRLLGGETGGYRGDSTSPTGRWPSNVVLTHQPLVDDTGNIIGDACVDGCVPGCPVADMDAQSGTRTSGSRKAGTYGLMGYMGADAAPMPAIAGDSGGASRFFPVFRYEGKAPASERPRGEDGTAHATVKPLALMRWLVRLATQPGGVVLDPFLGSGTTAEACVIEGFRCIGIERDESHLPLIKARLSKPIQPALGFEDAS
jgi:DNA modification methylase